MTTFTRRRATGFTAAIAIVAALLSPLVLAESARAAYPAPFIGTSANQQAWTDKQLGAMTVGVPYSDTIARGAGADSWASVGDLPAGLNGTLVGDAYVLSGTPTTPGDESFEIWSRLGDESDHLTFHVTVIAAPSTSLSLILAQSPATVSPGQVSNWEVRVKNTHDAYAQSPSISFTPPPGFAISSPFAYPNWNCSFGATIVCTNGVGIGFGTEAIAFTFVSTAPSSFATSTVTSSAQVSGYNAPAKTSSYTIAVNLPEATIAQPIASSYHSTTLTGYAPGLNTDGTIRFFTSAGVELGSANVQSNGSATYTGAIPASLSGTEVAFYAEYYDELGTIISTSSTTQPVYIYQQLNVGGSFYLNGEPYTGAVSLHIYADGNSPGIFIQRDLTGGSYAITPGGVPYEYYMFASIAEAGTTLYNDAGNYLPSYVGHTTVGPHNFTDSMNFYWESAPTFTDATVAAPRQDVPFTDGVTATNNVDVEYSINSGDLPDGLTLDTDTGAITGTATTEGEQYSFSIRATNLVNAQFANTATISGTVLAEHIVPTWTDSTLGEFRLNVPVADGVTAVGDPAITYAVSDGDLPTGVTLNTTTGQLDGAATVLGEDYEFEIRASNDWGDDDETFSGEVLPALTGPVWTDVELGELRVGETLTDAVNASGEPAPTYTSADNPAWLTIDPTTGAVSATPTTAGPYSFTITATSSEGTVSQLFTGTVEAAWTAPTFTDTTIVQPRVGVYLDDQVLATGDGPITYSVPLGQLPAWLTLNPANGLLSGTPPASALNEVYSFTVTASAHGLTDTVTISGFVDEAPEVAIDLNFVVGDLAAGAQFEYSISGAEGLAEYSVTVNSTPVIVAGGFTNSLGNVGGTAALPLNIAPGAHSIVLLTSASDGTPRTVTLWFTVLANGTIGAISTTGPFSVTAAAALAATGVDVGAPLGAALLLMLLGTVFIVRRRRWSEQA